MGSPEARLFLEPANWIAMRSSRAEPSRFAPYQVAAHQSRARRTQYREDDGGAGQDREVEAHERASAFFTGTRLRGRLRFGASEDFVQTRLPEILQTFRRDHPEVELELTVELSGTLHRQLEAGRLDLVLAKRRAGDTHGQLVWRDTLVWIGAPGLRIDPDRPVPLVVFPPPGITRARALEVLEEQGRSWRVACTSGSLSGLIAAARAGLGVMVHTRGLVPPGLVPVSARAGLPEPGGVDFVLLHGRRRGGAQQAADALAAAVLAGGDRLIRPPGGAGAVRGREQA